MDLNWNEARDTLREWRDSNVRDSERVIEIGEKLVRKYSSKLSDELWLVCEQVFIAALDTCRYDLAEICLDKLFTNFPNSSRVKKLEAMKFEAIGDFERALETYEDLEKLDDTDAAVKKRKIAILKNKDRDLAIKHLTVYLHTFMADQDAWMELADLYIEQMEYSKAAFCLEELILANSFNHLYHQRYAEIKYSQGGEENMKLARQYFAQAVKMSSNSNIRALYGLLLTSSLLSKSSSSKESNNRQYATWAYRVISEKYSEACGKNAENYINKLANIDQPELLASVNQLLAQLTVSETNS